MKKALTFDGIDISFSLVLVGILLFLIVFIGLPFVTIWSLNTLFGLSITYGFAEWGAALFLLFLSGGLTLGGKT